MDDMSLVYNINLCRICQIPKNFDLVDTSEATDNGQNYLDLLKFIFTDISWVEDRLISLACHMCIRKIEEIAAFKTICLESNNRRSTLSLALIKYEVEEVEIDEIPELKEVFDGYDQDGTIQQWRREDGGQTVGVSCRKGGIKRKHSDGQTGDGSISKRIKNEVTTRLRSKRFITQCSGEDEDGFEAVNDRGGRKSKTSKPYQCLFYTYKSFECHICHVLFNRTRVLERHIYKHNGVRTYICSNCGKHFITHDNLKNHLTNYCKDTPHDINIATSPKKRGPKPKPRRFVCDICHMIFDGTKPLERHVYKHNGVRNYACDSCDMKFITGADLKNHSANYCNKNGTGKKRGPKPKPPRFVCDICNKKFDGLKPLERHVYKHNGVRNYACDSCDMKFITGADLKNHSVNYCNKNGTGKKRGPKPKPPRFVCDICSKKFDGLKPLERHVYRHNGVRNHVCTGCGTRFITGDDLKNHELNHCNGIKRDKLGITGNHISRIRKYSCELCPTDFDRLGRLERHMYQHNGVRNYTCNGCDTKFITREDLKGHLRRHCAEEKLSCFLCPDKQFTPLTLEIHMKMIHMIGMDGIAVEKGAEASVDGGGDLKTGGSGERKSVRGANEKDKLDGRIEKIAKNKKEKRNKQKEVRSFKCHYCPMDFTRLKYLDRHVYNHDGTRNYICNDCGTRSITIDNLRSHMRVVHANREDFKFLCTECGARFPQSSGLKLHVKRIHTNIRNFVCDICNKAFCEKRDLQNHMTSHSDNREFKCDLCPAQYKRKDVLLIHKTKRHGIGNYKCQDEKKHECSFCDKKFNVRDKLNRHIRSHTGVKPFKCRLCDMKFVCKSYIKSHVMSKHSDLVDENEFDVNAYCEVLEDLVTTNVTAKLT